MIYKALLGLILVSLGILFLVTIIESQTLSNIPVPFTGKEEENKKPEKLTNFSFSPAIVDAPISTTSAQPISSSIIVETKNTLSGIQIELQYPAGTLTQVELKPSTDIQNVSKILFARNDSASGRLSLALSFNETVFPADSPKKVATLSFIPVARSSIEVRFLNKSMAEVAPFKESFLQQTRSLIIRSVATQSANH